ncbi:putative entry exclusion protein TrbK-alt [Acidiphilium sp. MT5]
MIARYRGAKKRWARGAAYAFVAGAITFVALQFQQREKAHKLFRSVTAQGSNNLSAELAHCQGIGMAAAQNRQCLAAWEREQKHFFSYRPVRSGASTAATSATFAVSTPTTPTATNISDLPKVSVAGAKTAPPKSEAP